MIFRNPPPLPEECVCAADFSTLDVIFNPERTWSLPQIYTTKVAMTTSTPQPLHPFPERVCLLCIKNCRYTCMARIMVSQRFKYTYTARISISRPPERRESYYEITDSTRDGMIRLMCVWSPWYSWYGSCVSGVRDIMIRLLLICFWSRDGHRIAFSGKGRPDRRRSYRRRKFSLTGYCSAAGKYTIIKWSKNRFEFEERQICKRRRVSQKPRLTGFIHLVPHLLTAVRGKIRTRHALRSSIDSRLVAWYRPVGVCTTKYRCPHVNSTPLYCTMSALNRVSWRIERRQ